MFSCALISCGKSDSQNNTSGHGEAEQIHEQKKELGLNLQDLYSERGWKLIGFESTYPKNTFQYQSFKDYSEGWKNYKFNGVDLSDNLNIEFCFNDKKGEFRATRTGSSGGSVTLHVPLELNFIGYDQVSLKFDSPKSKVVLKIGLNEEEIPTKDFNETTARIYSEFLSWERKDQANTIWSSFLDGTYRVQIIYNQLTFIRIGKPAINLEFTKL